MVLRPACLPSLPDYLAYLDINLFFKAALSLVQKKYFFSLDFK